MATPSIAATAGATGAMSSAGVTGTTSGVANETSTTTRPRASSLSRRPTTPLRRISASSLKSLSLSHSRSRPLTSSEPPLQHLGQVFAELADAMSDLAGNFEHLNSVNEGLDGFNEAFAGYLYGLRMNAYTADFDEAPTKLNFDLAAARAPPEPMSSIFRPRRSSGSSSSSLGHHGNETTFVTHDSEFSFSLQPETAKATSTRGGRSGGGGSTFRGGSGRGRGGAAAAAGGPSGRGGGVKVVLTKKKKDEMAAFADAVIQQLPIKFREQPQHRGEAEKVINVIREHPMGLSMAEFTKLCDVPTHRINDALTALVRAKIALKVMNKGVTSYRLDPTKYSPSS